MTKIPSINEKELEDAEKTSDLLEKLFAEAVTLTQESKEWPFLYRHGNVTTRHKKCTTDANKYIQRSSVHTADEITYDQLRSLLYTDHSVNEGKYMKTMETPEMIRHVANEADIFWLGFKTPFPSSNREFLELVATKEQGRQFIVVSQPVKTDHKIKKGHVRGAYQAWEIVKEIENDQGDKMIEWICIQHSSAGGWIPSVLSDHVAAKDFHHDVEAIIKYLKSV